MAHLTGFGLKNFRVFKDYQEFKFRPLTILTGPNNSGKSSLIKALLLIEKNFKNQYRLPKGEPIPINWLFKPLSSFFKLDFKDETHNLSSPTLVINDSKKPFEFLLRYGEYSYCFDFDQQGEIIFDYKLCRRKDELVIQQNGGDLRLNIKLFKDYIEYIDENINDINDKGFATAIIRALEIAISNGIKYIAVYVEQNKEGHLEVLYCQDKEQFGNFELYTRFHDNSFFIISDLTIDDIDLSLEYTFSFLLDNLLHVEFDYNKELLENLFDFLRKGGCSNFSLPNISFLPSIKGPQKRSIGISDNDEFAELVKTKTEMSQKDVDISFSKFGNGTYYHGINDFYNKWIRKFELGNRIDYGYNENVGVFYFEIDGKSLLDYGYGFTQISSILLWLNSKIISFSEEVELYEDNLLLIEEPEANLHPNFQSLLAEMIAEVTKKFGCRFIIETHSEYFIRKLQYLTAKKEIKPEDSVIYYFNHPKEVEKGAEQVKELHFREDGMMDGDFGPGFFDESTRLTIDLLKLQSKN